MNRVIVCIDCGAVFEKGEFSVQKKCDNCLERDQSYRERGIQERQENYASPEDE